MRPSLRGSRKHILDWVERSDFTSQLSQLIHSTGASIHAKDAWMPKGHGNPKEARLKQLGSQILPSVDWQSIQDWWLASKPRANTPNWDLASTCTIGGQQGLVLVEAKAHVQELKVEGKHLKLNASPNSRKNHERIGRAIKEAGHALGQIVSGTNISRDTHYQLANRVAFSWKIASLGVPVVLVYLGFLGDKNIADVGEPFRDSAHWQKEMRKYMNGCIPEEFTERWINCGKAGMQMVIRSLPVGQIRE